MREKVVHQLCSNGRQAREALLEKMQRSYKDASLKRFFSFHDDKLFYSNFSFLLEVEANCISATNDIVMVGMIFFHKAEELISKIQADSIKREARLKELSFPFEKATFISPSRKDSSSAILKQIFAEYPDGD